MPVKLCEAGIIMSYSVDDLLEHSDAADILQFMYRAEQHIIGLYGI